MLTRRESRLSQLMIIVQVLISIIIFYSLHFIFPRPDVDFYDKLFFITQIIIIWSFLFQKFGLGIIFRKTSFFDLIQGYFVTISIACVLLIVELRVLLHIGHPSYSAYYILFFCIFDLVALIIFKIVFYNFMRLIRKVGRNSRNVIIVGDASSIPFIDEFIRFKDWGYNIQQILSPDTSLTTKYENVKLVSNEIDFKKSITLEGIDDIFYCLSVADKHFDLEQIISDADEIGVTVHIMQFFALREKNFKSRFKNQEKESPIFLTHRTTSGRYRALKIKELLDAIVSPLILFFLSPLLLLIAIAIKLEDGGDVFFKQERIGLNGRRFKCLKFRSMVPNAEELINNLMDKNESDGPTFKIESDPRVTVVGRFLRKTSLDEIPQFYNVMKGDMSIVGPRPPLLKEVKLYERSQIRRLSMRPGITCIWQVSGRNKLSFSQWMDMDLQYIDQWSLWLDLKLIYRTIGVVLKANGQ